MKQFTLKYVFTFIAVITWSTYIQAECKDYTFVSSDTNLSKQKSGQLNNKKGGSIAIKGTPMATSLELIGCFDINGDGSSDAVIRDYGKAGRTIALFKIYSQELKLITSFVKEFGEDISFKDLNGDGIYEVVTTVRWAYWGNLGYRESPELPEVLCFKDNDLDDCTSEFPHLIKKEIDILSADSNAGYSTEQTKGRALKLIALYELLGKEVEGWKEVNRLYPDAYKWLKIEWDQE